MFSINNLYNKPRKWEAEEVERQDEYQISTVCYNKESYFKGNKEQF